MNPDHRDDVFVLLRPQARISFPGALQSRGVAKLLGVATIREHPPVCRGGPGSGNHITGSGYVQNRAVK